MSSIDFGNRNRFRKVYQYTRWPTTQNVQLIHSSSIQVITQSVDANQLMLHRDYYIVRDPSSAAPIIILLLGEYVEQTLAITGSASSAAIAFPITFTYTPVVTVEMMTASLSNLTTNISPYISALSTTEMTVQFSAHYSGSIRYRAMYSLNGWPVLVERTPDLPGQYITASAGVLESGEGVELGIDYSGSFNDTPSEVYTTAGIAGGELSVASFSGNVFAEFIETTVSKATVRPSDTNPGILNVIGLRY